jgi:hypothetical protein
VLLYVSTSARQHELAAAVEKEGRCGFLSMPITIPLAIMEI